MTKSFRMTSAIFVNITFISFSESEMSILRKDPKYNVKSKSKVWLQTLAFEAERAIKLLLHQNGKYTGSWLLNASAYYKRTTNSHVHTTHNLNPWSPGLVILPTARYETKTEQVIHSNNFLNSKTNPTESFQTQARKVINNRKALIPSDAKWKHINLNPPHRPSKD